MHGQSYGFNAYFKGDTVAFVRAATMERFARATVRNVARISDRILEVRFDRDIPTSMELNHDCIENMTCTPEVEIRNSYFTRTSTRGTLVTTPRKVVIENNTYYKTGMSAILIEADAEGWYESGPVKDVWIKGNTFIDCAYNGGPGHAVIAIHPSNKSLMPRIRFIRTSVSRTILSRHSIVRYSMPKVRQDSYSGITPLPVHEPSPPHPAIRIPSI